MHILTELRFTFLVEFQDDTTNGFSRGFPTVTEKSILILRLTNFSSNEAVTSMKDQESWKNCQNWFSG